MIKLILLKLVLVVLASLGIFFAGPRIRANFCYLGKTPTSSAPSNCERIVFKNVAESQAAGIVAKRGKLR